MPDDQILNMCSCDCSAVFLSLCVGVVLSQGVAKAMLVLERHVHIFQSHRKHVYTHVLKYCLPVAELVFDVCLWQLHLRKIPPKISRKCSSYRTTDKLKHSVA